MLTFTQSDIYQTYDKNRAISKRIQNLLAGDAKSVVLNDKLINDLNILIRTHKETTVLKAVNSIKSGEIILVKLDIDSNLPDFLPFIKAKRGGKEFIYVNLTKYVTESRDPDYDGKTGEIDYKIDNRKLYALVITAYIYLKHLSSDTALPPSAIQISATIWARMFNKVLIKTHGITSNKERYEAFMYFAMKFFMKYYLQSPDAVVDSIAMSYIKNKKSYLIEYMESKIEELNVNPYKSFTTFCHTLFNNEISNIKGIKESNIGEKINVSFYLRKFIDMYGISTLLSLSAYPYFLFVIVSSYNMSSISNDRALEDIVAYDKKEIPKLLTALYKELE